MIAPFASPTAVYSGTVKIGEVEILTRRRVIARVVTPDGLRPIGIFDDRRAAMLAVSRAARRPEPEPPEAA
jgi:hypothetical protein